MPTATPIPTASPTPTPHSEDAANICHHNCPDKLRFGAGTKLDQLAVKSGFQPDVALDPENEALRIVLANADGTILDEALAPHDIVRKGASYTYTNRSASKTGGIAAVTIRKSPDGTGTRVNITVYGDFSAATEALMTLEITLGDDMIVTTATWQQKPYGWMRNHR